MGHARDIEVRAALWRAAAELTRGRAARVQAIATVRWDAPAAGAFRSRVGDRAAALRRVAELEDDVGVALDTLARAVGHLQRVLDTAQAAAPERQPDGSGP